MSELIKYASTDVLDGLKYVRVGLANIISHVINTGEDYIIHIPIRWSTLEDLLICSIPKCFVSLDYHSLLKEGVEKYIMKVKNDYLEITKNEGNYKFSKI